MELALYIKNINDYKGKRVINYSLKVGDHEKNLSGQADAFMHNELLAEMEFTYLYFGCEFCEYMLPSPSQIEQYLQLCKREGLVPVFVTPVVTDYGIKKIEDSLHIISSNADCISVVVNDYGVMDLVNDYDHKIPMFAGRILDKTTHECRATEDELKEYYGEDGLMYAKSPGIVSFSHRLALRDYNIIRYEFDLSCVGLNSLQSACNISIYWPYNYETTGRVCFFNAIDRIGRSKFLVGERCSCRCKDIIIDRRSISNSEKKTQTSFIQDGNTIYYVSKPEQIMYSLDGFDRLIIQIL